MFDKTHENLNHNLIPSNNVHLHLLINYREDEAKSSRENQVLRIERLADPFLPIFHVSHTFSF